MKRIFVTILLLMFTLTLTGCKSEEDLFNDALKNMQNLENATMDMTVSMSLFGEDIELTSKAKIDGNMMEMDILNEVTYVMNYDSNDFELIDLGNGSFGAIYSPSEDEDDFFGLPELEDLTFQDFDLVEDYYVYNGESDEFGLFKIKIEDGRITQMILELEEDFQGMTMSMMMTIDIYDFGTTTIEDKPLVPKFDEYAPVMIDLAEEGYTIMFEGEQLVIIGPNSFSLVFDPTSDHSSGTLELNPQDDTIWMYNGETEDFFSFDEYFNYTTTPQVSRDIVELIDDLLDIWAD